MFKSICSLVFIFAVAVAAAVIFTVPTPLYSKTVAVASDMSRVEIVMSGGFLLDEKTFSSDGRLRSHLYFEMWSFSTKVDVFDENGDVQSFTTF